MSILSYKLALFTGAGVEVRENVYGGISSDRPFSQWMKNDS